MKSPTTNKKQGVVFLLFAAAFVAGLVGVFVLREMAQGKRQFITMMTFSFGKEIIETTNSSLVAAISPELHKQLSQLFASATRVAGVRLGDEPPPAGDGRACSRIILTNALAHGLGIRLGLGSIGQSTFDILGYWTFSKPGGATNRNQPVYPDTNRTSAALGSSG